MSLKKRLKADRYRRLVHQSFLVTGAVLSFFPRRFLFLLFIVAEVGRLPARRHLYQAYLPYATSYLADHPDFRFSTGLSRCFTSSSVVVLHGIGAYWEVSHLADGAKGRVMTTNMRQALARSLFELGEFEKARAVAAEATQDEISSVADLAHYKAMLEVIADDEAGAIESLHWASRGNLNLLRPHQNIAARASASYLPNALDFICGAPGRLYDLCNFTGQRVTHVGRGEVGIDLYKTALKAQEQLRATPPTLSSELESLLRQLEISFDELRIIPEEWTTQIGHLGMLDILFRIRELGWWSGKAVIVVRRELIANKAFFTLLEGFGKIVVVGETVPERIADELLSLQRWCGLNFNAFQLPDGTVVPWQEAGALAIAQWEKEGRNSPLREEYDRVFGSREDVNLAFELARREWGMKPTDWYVCLHVRDAAHYLELSGTGQTHRNSPLEDYMEAIRFITGKGGWVIKLGGENSPKLPKMDRTVDYALRGPKSELLDIHLIRNAKAFIGTTSGLTNVAVSFGIPSALVNCISTDSQLWNQRVRFALKAVRLADGIELGAKELSSAPWRWRVFDAAVLARTGGHLQNNTPGEICEVVREVDALASGRSVEFESQYEAEALLSHWRQQLSLPHYYGTGRPGLDLLKKQSSLGV
jgi:putative glycosyltransferase (TIGR04372 family)